MCARSRRRVSRSRSCRRSRPIRIPCSSKIRRWCSRVRRSCCGRARRAGGGRPAKSRPRWHARFERVLHLGQGTVDGGDVLATPRGVFIGRSARTNAAGAQALIALLADIGLQGFAVTTPGDVLHFKSDCSLIDEATILATARLARVGVFEGFRVVVVPEGEEGGANAVRVNDRVLMSDAFPRTAELLAGSGYRIVPLSTREIAKFDAGLSCMSLRWRYSLVRGG